jgi:hypothetical protein
MYYLHQPTKCAYPSHAHHTHLVTLNMLLATFCQAPGASARRAMSPQHTDSVLQACRAGDQVRRHDQEAGHSQQSGRAHRTSSLLRGKTPTRACTIHLSVLPMSCAHRTANVQPLAQHRYSYCYTPCTAGGPAAQWQRPPRPTPPPPPPRCCCCSPSSGTGEQARAGGRAPAPSLF